jgi:hypothetical protein
MSKSSSALNLGVLS